MRTMRTVGRRCGLAYFAVIALAAQSTPMAKLPQRVAVKDSGPRVYTFTVDYYTANSLGEIYRRQRVAGEYVRGLKGGEVEWRKVAIAETGGLKSQFGPPKKRDFMEGFRYVNDLSRTFKPDFFQAFPASAVYERNLVWDAGMIEHFGQDYFGQLHPNEPHHVLTNDNVNMPGVGSFRNRDVVLEWVGRSRRNGQDCAVILYKAFFNPVRIANAGMIMNARSDYWGEIWVSLKTKQIEYGTIHESVVGEMNLPGQGTPRPVNVFRTGVFAPEMRGGR